MNCTLALIVLIFGAPFAVAQEQEASCCNDNPGGGSAEVVRMTTDQIRRYVDHIEPLRPSGLDRNLRLSGILVVEVRFGTDGKVECVRATSGTPIAIAAAVEALPQWTFKPFVSDGIARRACGKITIAYRFSNKSSSTKLKN